MKPIEDLNCSSLMSAFRILAEAVRLPDPLIQNILQTISNYNPETGIVNCWCVTDFDVRHIIVRCGKMWPNGSVSTSDHYIHMTNIHAANAMWSSFNDWQFTPVPFLIKE